MKTTIDLPEELINEAMAISNSKSKIEAIKTALLEMIAKEKRLIMVQLRHFDNETEILNRLFKFLWLSHLLRPHVVC